MATPAVVPNYIIKIHILNIINFSFLLHFCFTHPIFYHVSSVTLQTYDSFFLNYQLYYPSYLIAILII
jgi:hypothetical protein